MPPTRHDALFRLLVSDPGRAAALLRDYLPSEVRERLDHAPEHIKGTAIDGEGRTTQADAIFRVRMAGAMVKAPRTQGEALEVQSRAPSSTRPDKQRRTQDENGEAQVSRVDDVRHIAALLSDPNRPEHPREFPANSITANKPGLYSWWADAEAQELFLGTAGGISVGQPLHVGQAGATLWPSGRKSTATLKSRIHNNHIRGNLSSSTFRRTISALLREPLNLRLAEPGKLMPEENRRVSTWIKDHMRVGIVSMEDRDFLGCIEQAVLDTLDPPFNLNRTSRAPPV